MNHTRSNTTTKRLTVSMPQVTYDQLIQQIPEGSRSSFISDAIQSELMYKTFKKNVQKSAVEKFIALTESLPKTRMTMAQLKKAIAKGRA